MREEVAKELANRFLEEAATAGASIGELQWACGMAQSRVLGRVGKMPVRHDDKMEEAASGGDR